MNTSPTPFRASSSRKSYGGFTLIEVMIVVAIIALLASIAMPSYTEYVLRSERAKARGAVVQAAQWMERAATAQGRYPVSTNVPSEIPAGILAVEGGRYALQVVSSVSAYTVTATRQAAQVSDKCGDLLLDQAGTKTVINSTVPAANQLAECWNR